MFNAMNLVNYSSNGMISDKLLKQAKKKDGYFFLLISDLNICNSEIYQNIFVGYEKNKIEID